MSITTFSEFEDGYLVRNGMPSNDINLNKAPRQLKSEIDELNVLKQEVLVSGNNIKTLNGSSLLGSGNIDIILDWQNITSKPTTLSSYGITDAYTKAEINSEINNAIMDLIDAAPTALDTLNEISAALNDDPNFASTITTQLGTKQATLVSGTNIKTINGTSVLGSGDIVIQVGTVLNNDDTTNSSFYPVFTSSTSGSITSASVSSSKLYFNPSTGTLNSLEFNAFSDLRLKENVKTIDNPLQKVLSLRGVNYNIIGDETKENKMGLIAQEVQEIIPEVINSKGEYLTVNYNSIVGLLIETIKELNQKIEKLEAKI